jgi:formate hydrogenlyase subunit 6/NADH:ubiquinone oxidoreductase subunit I
MPQWFVRGLRRGVVTTRYPAGPDPSARFLPVPPAFRAAAMTRQTAEALVRICPSAALTLAAGALVFDAGACTACGRCRALAPEAVVPGDEFELAAVTRTALIKQIPLFDSTAPGGRPPGTPGSAR